MRPSLADIGYGWVGGGPGEKGMGMSCAAAVPHPDAAPCDQPTAATAAVAVMARQRLRRRRPPSVTDSDAATTDGGQRPSSTPSPPTAGTAAVLEAAGAAAAAAAGGGGSRALAPSPASPAGPPSAPALLSWSAGVWRVFVAVTAIKLLLVPAYRSTDYDVHVHWLALTASTPLSAWYTDTSSRWTLDYPPLFALVTRALAAIAEALDVDEGSLTRPGGGPAPTSPAAVLFMRASVMAADAVLAAGTARLLTALLPRRRVAAGVALTTAAAVLLHPGLLLVDHIHFQYNGLCLGVLLASVAAAVEGAPVAAAVAAAAAFNLKHTLVPAALPLGVHLLAAGLEGDRTADGDGGGGGSSGAGGSAPVSLRARASHLGAIVISGVDALVLPWLPFLMSAGDEGPFAATAAMVARLVPTGRGLLHSYWAANAWAVVTAADRAACAVVRAAVGGGKGEGGGWVGTRVATAATALARLLPWAAAPPLRAAATCAAAAARGSPSATGGVVGVTAPWALLPPVTPAACAVAAVVGTAPALGGLAAAAVAGGAATSARRLPGAVAAAGLAAFFWGYHVHEKAILLASVPLAVTTAVTAARAEVGGRGGEEAPRSLSARARAECRAFVWVALGGHWALLPLLPGPAEAVVKVVAVAGYAAVYLPRLWSLGGGGVWSTTAVLMYAVGMGVLEAYAGVGGAHTRLWGAAYPFVPLLLVSVYAAVGVAAAYGTLVWQDLWGEEEEGAGRDDLLEGGGTAARAYGSDTKED